LDYLREKQRQLPPVIGEQRFNEGSNFSKNLVLRPKADHSRMHSQLEDPLWKLGFAEKSRFWSEAKIPFGENECGCSANSQ
jgi:hypothetical protein